MTQSPQWNIFGHALGNTLQKNYPEKMEATKGTLNVSTENIFPIIKKFLYSDHEIFLRELVANAVDASQKIKRLASLGEFNGELGDVKVSVNIDKENKTLTISDNGIGMSAEEIERYINTIALSGATEFVEKFKGVDDAKQIIGKFGLGFYSAFMVAKKVELVTKSFKEESDAANRWSCEGSTEYDIAPATRDSRGTDVILHIAEDSEEFLEESRIREILTKYAKFLPIEVEFGGQKINNPEPLWTKSPSDLTDEDYKSFYKELYPAAYKDPLFWIHLNVDYPFNLTGVLYFPKIEKQLTLQQDKIQLYSRQVFITDEVKNIVPEFLMLLHGVIDSPDIPLNVSRSYLQTDGNVRKINNYIMRKVAEKLQEIFKNNREDFAEKWDNIATFVKFGMVSEDKFREKAEKFALYKNVDGEHYTMDEYLEKIAPNQTDKNETRVLLYAQNTEEQHSFIQSAKALGYDVLLLDGPLDAHFMNRQEAAVEKISFRRVDADIPSKLIDKGEEESMLLSDEQQESAKKFFEEVVNDTRAAIEVKPLGPNDLPVMITFSEFMRRFREMSQTGGMAGSEMLNDTYNVVLNGNHKLISELLEESDEEKKKLLARQVLDLGLLSQNMLRGQALTDFVARSLDFVGK